MTTALSPERLLAESEQRLRLALHATHLGLWEWDLPDGTPRWSDEALELVGLSATDAEADVDAVRRLVHRDDVEVLWMLDDAARDGRRFHGEYRIVRPDGTVRWVSNHAWTNCDVQGRPVRMIGTLADITPRRQAEHDLRASRDQLEARVLERTDALAAANTALVNEVAERRAAELHARELLGQLVNAEEEERRRLSRDLHDSLGQHMAALAISLKAIAQEPTLPPPLRARVAELQQAVGALDDEIGRLAHELRPSALDDLGIGDALQRHSANWSQQSGISVDIVAEGLRGRRFSPAIETTVYRIVQEALTNVRKHAGASRVGVIVELRGGELRTIVEDDGHGFEATASGWPPLDGHGLGLRGMAERARLCGGRVEVESTLDTGTTVYLSIPLREPT